MKVGVFGGSFDPIHMGHMVMAEHVRDCAKLDRLIVLPAWKSPFKVGKGGASPGQRLEMTVLAFRNNEDAAVSDYEMKCGRVLYTVDTLRELRKSLKEDDRIYFILGTDSFLSLEKWHGAEELLESYGFAVGKRPGGDDSELNACAERIRRAHGTEIIIVDVPQYDVSSTDIRERVRDGRSIRYLVPDEVEKYILDQGLYRD